MYNQYATSIKSCFSLGLENCLIPKNVLKMIPSSTASSWRKGFDSEKIIGQNIDSSIRKDLKGISASHHPVNYLPRKVFYTFCEFTQMFVTLFDKKTLLKTFRKKKDVVINYLEKLSDWVSYSNIADCLSISTKTLYNWRNQVLYKCQASPIFLCVKRHLNQASYGEVKIISKYLTMPTLQHWGIHSIWALAFKKGETKLSKNTWYRYNKLLSIRESITKGQKPKYCPIIAERVNQILHADITLFKTRDGERHFIYTVMDNYSRYILSWQISDKVRANTRLATIREAIQRAFNGNKPTDLELITDGGPENDNHTIKEFFAQHGESVRHHIALRDIPQSNSMMEAFYSVAKYRYLYLQSIENGNQLQTRFEELIDEYNNQRPHYALGIFTPAEVQNGAVVRKSFPEVYAEAAKKRREYNKNNKCSLKC